MLKSHRMFQQESSPAWTQQAYRPPCSEYSFCCPILADPPSPRLTDLTHPLRLTDLTPLPGWLTWPTSPPAGLTPPQGVDKLTKWNYYLPVVLRTRAVKMWTEEWRLDLPLFHHFCVFACDDHLIRAPCFFFLFLQWFPCHSLYWTCYRLSFQKGTIKKITAMLAFVLHKRAWLILNL